MTEDARECAPTGAVTKPFNGQTRTGKGVEEQTEGMCGEGVRRKAPGGNTRGMSAKESEVRITNSVGKRTLLEGPHGKPEV